MGGVDLNIAYSNDCDDKPRTKSGGPGNCFGTGMGCFVFLGSAWRVLCIFGPVMCVLGILSLPIALVERLNCTRFTYSLVPLGWSSHSEDLRASSRGIVCRDWGL